MGGVLSEKKERVLFGDVLSAELRGHGSPENRMLPRKLDLRGSVDFPRYRG